VADLTGPGVIVGLDVKVGTERSVAGGEWVGEGGLKAIAEVVI